MNKEIFIYDMLRVPTGKKGGIYKHVLIEDLAAHLIDLLIDRNALFNRDIELLLANSIGTMGNMSRYAALKSRLPISTRSSTVDLQCGGSYQTLRLGKALLAAGEGELALVGGMESNSLMPTRSYVENDPRFNEEKHIEKAQFSPFPQLSLELAAKNLAVKYNIEKDELTRWTKLSHQRAESFAGSNTYKQYVKSFGSEFVIDQTIKKALKLKLLEKLGSQALIDRTNTADFHDGAAIALIGTEKYKNVKPLAKIHDVVLTGIDPDNAPEGILQATEKLLQKNNRDISEIDLFEINESFAVKPLSFAKHFKVEKERINILGGNLAYGHPYAASGIINLMHLILALKQKNKRFGLVSAGIAGGFGAAILVENVI